MHPIVEFVKRHSKGGGLGINGLFCLRYWREDFLLKKPSEISLTDNGSIIFGYARSITLKDLEDKDLQTISLDDPRLQNWFYNKYANVRELFLRMMVVGVGNDGRVYRVADKDIVMLTKLPPGWSTGMFVEAVKVFLTIRPILNQEEELEAARGNKRKANVDGGGKRNVSVDGGANMDVTEDSEDRGKAKYTDVFMGGLPGFMVKSLVVGT